MGLAFRFIHFIHCLFFQCVYVFVCFCCSRRCETVLIRLHLCFVLYKLNIRFVFTSIGWLVKNKRKKEPIMRDVSLVLCVDFYNKHIYFVFVCENVIFFPPKQFECVPVLFCFIFIQFMTFIFLSLLLLFLDACETGGNSYKKPIQTIELT